MSSQPQSLYALAARDGLIIGAVMVLTFLTLVLSSSAPLLGTVSLVLLCVTPYLIWRLIRRHWINRQIPSAFSAVWLTGICIFLFGSIILALGIYVILGMIMPDWIQTQTLLAANRLAENPSTVNEAKTIIKIIQSGQLPSPIYVAVSMIWFVGFTGSLWSLIFAFIITRSKRLMALRSNHPTQF